MKERKEVKKEWIIAEEKKGKGKGKEMKMRVLKGKKNAKRVK